MDDCSPMLPIELIIRVLELSNCPSTLANAALCSRQWNDIAVPVLYRNINISLSRINDLKGPRILSRLTRLFFQAPELAAHVRHFSVRGAFIYGKPEPTDPGRWIDENTRTAIARASLSDEEREDWLQHMHYSDAMLALVLPTMKNLETMDLGFLHSRFLRRMLERAANQEGPFQSKPAFPRLHSLVWALPMNDVYGRIITSPFLFPSIQSIYFSGVGVETSEVTPRVEVAQGKARSSNCTVLEMRDCRLEGADLKAVLRFPLALKAFVYELGDVSTLDVAACSTAKIRDAVEIHKDTLEDLWLDAVPRWTPWIDVCTPMSSFKNFHQLKRLRIATYFVFGNETEPDSDKDTLLELLPPGLEVLHLSHGDNARSYEYGEGDEGTIIYEAFEHLLRNRDVSVPALKKLIYSISKPGSQKHRKSIERISRLAASIGVAFFLRKKIKDSDLRYWGWDEDIEWAQNDYPSFCRRDPPEFLEILDEHSLDRWELGATTRTEDIDDDYSYWDIPAESPGSAQSGSTVE